MASATATEQISVVRLGEHIRRIWQRLTPLEDATSQNKTEIKHLKQEAEEVRAGFETIKVLVETQDVETSNANHRITEIQSKVSGLEMKIAAHLAAHDAEIQAMNKKIHGERVKRGLALSRAKRAEKKVAAINTKKSKGKR